MKRLWPCLLAVLAFSSCISVEDFGTYWDKGFVDRALEGEWKKIGLPGEDRNSIPAPDVWRFTRNGESYWMQYINPIDPTAKPDVIEQQKKDNEWRGSARSLRIGKRTFLMLRDRGRDGVIERYEVRRGTLREYWVDYGAAAEFLKAKHPTAKNIEERYGYVVIVRFDDEVFQVLSELADDPAYWFLRCEYKRMP